MHADQPHKPDNLLGICNAIGEDFGFNPLYLRITLAVLLLWNPWVVLGVYFGAGVVVAISRLLFPNPRRKQVAETPALEMAQAA